MKGLKMSHNAVAAMAVMMVAGFAGCAATARSETVRMSGDFAKFNEQEPSYRFFPGDTIDVNIPSAPELSRSAAPVAPDGRITLPLIPPQMAAGRTAEELTQQIKQAYGAQLRDPVVEIAPRAFGSRQIFVGGEVEKPGVYEIAAAVDPMQAVIQAGGFRNSARRGEVLILRRTPAGRPDVYRVNLTDGAFRQGLPSSSPLERFDVVYVPRSPIAKIGLFMDQYVREALPVQFSLYYNLAPDRN
jgi:polysaccharide export outer membrane protein